jgi:hypothetical protein
MNKYPEGTMLKTATAIPDAFTLKLFLGLYFGWELNPQFKFQAEVNKWRKSLVERKLIRP